MKRSELHDAIVVITGASSGIGRATAHAFARSGATVVLASRRESALQETLQECERLGGRGIVVPTDVVDAEPVERLVAPAGGRHRAMRILGPDAPRIRPGYQWKDECLAGLPAD